MQYTVQKDGIRLGIVDLPVGSLVAARLDPLPGYESIKTVVRQATRAFLHLGLFGAVAPLQPPISTLYLRQRRAMTQAAGLRLELVDTHGDAVATTFVNLLDAPTDAGVVVLASFVEAQAPIGAERPTSPNASGARRPTTELRSETNYDMSDDAVRAVHDKTVALQGFMGESPSHAYSYCLVRRTLALWQTLIAQVGVPFLDDAEPPIPPGFMKDRVGATRLRH